MRSGLGRRSGIVAALVLISLAAGPVSPASAEPVILRPAEGATVETSAVTVSGRAEAQTALGLALGTLDSVTLKIGEQTVTSPGCSGVRTCDFTGSFTLPRNGSYTVEVTARTSGLATGGTLPPRTFSVAAPAATPVLDPPKVTEGRSVELSWSRNTEPDMLQYEVIRTDPGAPKPVSATIQQPDRGAKVTFTDPTTAALDGRTYTYEVKAVRRGATENSRIPSEASRRVSASVPALATTSSTVATGVPAGGPTTTTTARTAPPAGVDLSGFLSSRSQPIPVPTITVPEPPDTGFSGRLPFGVGPGGEELEEGEADAVPPPDRRRSSSVVSVDAARPLVPIAGGLVLLLLALHMRLLGRRVKAAPDHGDLPVEVAQEPPGAAPVPDPRPQPVTHPDLYDVALDPDPDPDDEDEDERWAGAVEAEPEAVSPDDDDDDEDRPEIVVEPEAVVVATVVPGYDVGEYEYEEEDEDWAAAAVGPEPPPVEPLALEYEPNDDDWAAAAIATEPIGARPEPEPEPEPVALWGPPEVTDEEPPPAEIDPEAIEVVEVVSSSRRRLVRAGGR